MKCDLLYLDSDSKTKPLPDRNGSGYTKEWKRQGKHLFTSIAPLYHKKEDFSRMWQFGLGVIFGGVFAFMVLIFLVNGNDE